jgi:hypothetical protein
MQADRELTTGSETDVAPPSLPDEEDDEEAETD